MSFDDGLILGLSLGGGSGGDYSSIFGVYGIGTSELTVATKAAEELTYHIFSLDVRTFSQSTTIRAGDNVITRSWSSKAIENAYDVNGDIVYHCKLDSSGDTVGIYTDMEETKPIDISSSSPTAETEVDSNE